MVVAAHDDEHIFDRDDKDERPEDQADNTVKVGHIDLKMVARVERRLQRVQRAGTDIAVHHADRTQGQRGG